MSHPHDNYRFALEHFTRDGRRLGQTLVSPDFQPAREWAYFAAVRRGALPLVTAPADGEVAPIWSDELGAPYCSGVSVLGSEIPSAYFHELARAQAAAYLARGELASGEPYDYLVCAYPADLAGVPAEHSLDFGVEALPEPIALGSLSLADLAADSEPTGAQHALDAPVFVADEVIDGVRELAQKAGDLETGGVLIGRLQRDSTRPEVFAQIVAQIPARHAEARGTSFAFTPETWAAAHAAIELRGRRELMLGWWHSHPCFCRSCPAEQRRSCTFARPHFSAEDVHLHRTCFPQAWQLALLVSDLPETGLTSTLFGWRLGKVVERGFGLVRGFIEEGF